jgi:hypothetical protein
VDPGPALNGAKASLAGRFVGIAQKGIDNLGVPREVEGGILTLRNSQGIEAKFNRRASPD